jgi:hypothetical protein
MTSRRCDSRSNNIFGCRRLAYGTLVPQATAKHVRRHHLQHRISGNTVSRRRADDGVTTYATKCSH